MPIKISHSRTELYTQCPRKYRYRYLDKLKVDQTPAALLFGSACDLAFNYLLLRKKHGHTPHLDTSKKIFIKHMNTWHGQNELVFFKGELPAGYEPGEDAVQDQDVCFTHLCEVGQMMLDVYHAETLPLFKEIVSVQTKKVIKNEEEDEFTLVVDFVATLHDGRTVLFDNKTTSDLKTYTKNAVKKSQQLALYVEYEKNRLAGYICFQKKLVDGKIVWKWLVDEVPEEQSVKAFELVDNVLRDIKDEKFEKNEKACMLFNKRCEFWGKCKYNSDVGIIKGK